MTGELLLLRHGEAEAGLTGRDFDRRLTAVGRAEIRTSAARMVRGAFRPDLVVASPAARTRATAEIVCEIVGDALAAVVWERRIYNASLDALLEIVSEHLAESERVLLVGHNPGLSQLLAHACSDTLASRRLGLSTGTLARIELVRPARVVPARNRLLELSHPRADS